MTLLSAALVLVFAAFSGRGRAPQEPPLNKKARVIYVDVTHSFLAIDKGESDGLKVGMKFEIVQEKAGKSVTLGTARLRKFLGTGRFGKLVFEEGDLGLAEADDWALYRLKE